MTKKRQPLRAAAAPSAKVSDGGAKRQKVEDSVASRNNNTSSSSAKRSEDDDNDDGDVDGDDGEDDDDDDEEDDDIALEGQLHFTEPITFEFNDPKEEYAESITVLLKQVPISPFCNLTYIPNQFSHSYQFDCPAGTVCTESKQGLFLGQSDS